MHRFKSLAKLSFIISIVLISGTDAKSANKSLQSRSANSAKSRQNLGSKLLSNPKSTYKILLDSHVHFDNGEGWRKVSILTPDGKSTLVSDLSVDEPGCCYQLSENDWSPDGKYLRLIHMTDYTTPNSRQDIARIIDVGRKDFVDFQSADETPLTYDHTAFEWILAKPHSIEVTSEKTGKSEEALPSQ